MDQYSPAALSWGRELATILIDEECGDSSRVEGWSDDDLVGWLEEQGYEWDGENWIPEEDDSETDWD